MNRRKVVIGAIVVSLFFGLIYKLFVYHQETYEVGIARNQFTGEVTLIETAGFNFGYPWVWVSLVDTRPTTVCMTTTAKAYNCKLVRFVPSYYQEFVAVEGWRFYWWSNRISFNFGYNDEYRGMRDILRGHAFGIKKYPFIEILE